MQHIRIFSPPAVTDVVIDLFSSHTGVAQLIVLKGAGIRPPSDLVEADVAREATARVLAALDELPGGTDCAVTVGELSAVKSDQAEHAQEAAKGFGSDAVVWEEVEARTSEESQLSWSFLALLTAAVLLAGIGVLIDSRC